MRAIQGLEGVPTIGAKILKEAWPYIDFAETGPLDSSTATTKVLSVVAHVSRAVPSLVDFTLETAVKHILRSGDTFDFEQLSLLPGEAPKIKKILRSLNPFPSDIQLVRVLSGLKEGTCVDLSGFQLSSTQIVEVLSNCGNIAFLDASFNRLIVADDIPKILEAAPTLRRIVVIGCTSIADAHILTLVQNEPSRFKSLEGLLHPAFLTIRKPDSYPIAFTLVNVTYGDLTCASVPFFTPAQVVQLLIDLLPWKDAKINRGLGGSLSPMTGFSALHRGGARTPGQKFGERAVVSVPFLSPQLPRGQRDFWVFAVYRASKYGFIADEAKNRKNMWGFVHITRSVQCSTGDSEASTDEPATGTGSGTAEQLGYSTRLYDLRGFLECMASEGRPMPSDAAVTELERILYKKHRKTGESYCPFMREEGMREMGIDPSLLA